MSTFYIMLLFQFFNINEDIFNLRRIKLFGYLIMCILDSHYAKINILKPNKFNTDTENPFGLYNFFSHLFYT